MVAITCPNCDVELNVPQQRIGKVGKCPSCRQPFTPEMPPPPLTLTEVMAPTTQTALIVGRKTLAATGVIARYTGGVVLIAGKTTGAIATGFGRLTANYLERRAERKHELAMRRQEYVEAAKLIATQPQSDVAPVASVPQQIFITNTATANAVVTGGRVQRWSPGVAALLSFLIPGLGQLYKGQLISGFVWFVVVLVGYVCFIVPGLVLHLCCVIGAASGDCYR